ncbi:LysR family transcriptional regulator [Chelatococcus reniformis]|uniref:LysR family transcriptional regulator n=1 Tax=Chelatococcus reniformis TaxID=1494448 RepID=A0A916UR10_9HYPH|nr:LysR family transcriptional regulator [Chelatococcus reniformis]GGC83996.1 LysR family transcriptional regulator [Chelatococcus reniformis]
MTLEQLRIFVAVAEREHVTRAARELHLTQSATSAAVAALEARYATKLFDRVGRRIALTDAGRLFLVEAKAVLVRAAAAETVLTDLAGVVRGSLVLSASQTVANYWLPAYLHRFKESYPRIEVSLSIGNTERVAALVHDAAADLGFVEGEIDDPTVAATCLAHDGLVLVVPAAHPWAGRQIAGRELTQARWVLREPGSGTRAIFEGALPRFGVAAGDLDVALELPSNEAVRAAVEAGAGATVISRLVVAGALEAGTLAAVDIALPARAFFLLRHKERYLTRAAEALVELLPRTAQLNDHPLRQARS